jgi:tRNA(fMet)-specific endonuclease VapC
MIGELMLDTKAVSALVKGQASRLAALLDKQAFCISVITEAELRFGLARRPVNPDLRRIVEQFLATAMVKPWDSDCAQRYALLRAELETRGTPLAPMDLLIAAHALAEDCTLVSADRAFGRVPGLTVIDWSLAATTRKAAKAPKSS